MSAGRPATPTQGTPHVVWSDAARALGGLALAERRWYLVVRCLMMGVLVTLITGHYLFGLTLHTATTIIVLALIMPPTMVGVWLHWKGRFTDGWLLALLLSDVAVLTIGNHWSGGVESSFGYSYLAVVLASALFLDASAARISALLCAVAYVTLCVLEYGGWVRHYDFLGVPLEHNTTFVAYECVMKSTVFLATSLVATAVVQAARRAYARLEDQERRMRQFAAEALAMLEDENRRIARDLHDGAGQALTAARLHLQAAASYANRMMTPQVGSDIDGMIRSIGELAWQDSRRIRDSVLATARLLDAAIDEVRSSAAALGPAALDELGLMEALRRHCDDLKEASGVQIELVGAPHETSDPEGPRMPAMIERACYRIAQEALNNAIKHARAKRIQVQVVEDEGTLGVEIRDDGVGFDPETVEKGLGLAGMRDRVVLLGGTFEVESQTGGGTRIYAVIPIHHEEAMV
jgi:signal transduction histidine kinase